MPQYTCLTTHVSLHMSHYTCLTTHVSVHMSQYTCLTTHVSVHMSQYTCLSTHVSVHMSQYTYDSTHPVLYGTMNGHTCQCAQRLKGLTIRESEIGAQRRQVHIAMYSEGSHRGDKSKPITFSLSHYMPVFNSNYLFAWHTPFRWGRRIMTAMNWWKSSIFSNFFLILSFFKPLHFWSPHPFVKPVKSYLNYSIIQIPW